MSVNKNEEKMNVDFDELVVDYLTGNLRGKRAARFLEMIDEDENCAKRFDELNRLYAISLTPHYESGRNENWTRLHRRIRRQNKSIAVPRWVYVAAALVIGVVSGICMMSLMNDASSEGLFCEIVVPEGSRTHLTLPDSSVVWLNSGSRLSYSKNFGEENRDIWLSGEGYFEVHRDEEHPFIVSADQMKVKVLGTIFNFCAEEGASTEKVDLIKGKVEVSVGDGNTMVLAPGQQAVLDKETGVLSSAESDLFVSDWVNGRLSFVNIPMTEIFARLQKHFNVRIDVCDEHLAEEYFTGSIDLNLTLDEILAYLDVDKKYSVTMKDGIISVSAGTN